MLKSWHNFLFVSFDPAGLVTIDKPPLGVWVQVASAKAFGFSPLLPAPARGDPLHARGGGALPRDRAAAGPRGRPDFGLGARRVPLVRGGRPRQRCGSPADPFDDPRLWRCFETDRRRALALAARLCGLDRTGLQHQDFGCLPDRAGHSPRLRCLCARFVAQALWGCSRRRLLSWSSCPLLGSRWSNCRPPLSAPTSAAPPTTPRWASPSATTDSAASKASKEVPATCTRCPAGWCRRRPGTPRRFIRPRPRCSTRRNSRPRCPTAGCATRSPSAERSVRCACSKTVWPTRALGICRSLWRACWLSRCCSRENPRRPAQARSAPKSQRTRKRTTAKAASRGQAACHRAARRAGGATRAWPR